MMHLALDQKVDRGAVPGRLLVLGREVVLGAVHGLGLQNIHHQKADEAEDLQSEASLASRSMLLPEERTTKGGLLFGPQVAGTLSPYPWFSLEEI